MIPVFQRTLELHEVYVACRGNHSPLPHPVKEVKTTQKHSNMSVSSNKHNTKKN